MVLEGQAKAIFNDVACVDLAYRELPLQCPLANAGEQCRLRKRGQKLSGKYVSAQGMRLAPW